MNITVQSLHNAAVYLDSIGYVGRAAELEMPHVKKKMVDHNGLGMAYDLELPVVAGPVEVDFEERAHHLGIHLFPSSSYPFLICLGIFLLALAAIPFGAPVRWVVGIVGMAIFLIGVFGWVVLEDVHMYPQEDIPVERAPSGGNASSAHHEEERH